MIPPNVSWMLSKFRLSQLTRVELRQATCVLVIHCEDIFSTFWFSDRHDLVDVDSFEADQFSQKAGWLDVLMLFDFDSLAVLCLGRRVHQPWHLIGPQGTWCACQELCHRCCACIKVQAITVESDGGPGQGSSCLSLCTGWCLHGWCWNICVQMIWVYG